MLGRGTFTNVDQVDLTIFRKRARSPLAQYRFKSVIITSGSFYVLPGQFMAQSP